MRTRFLPLLLLALLLVTPLKPVLAQRLYTFPLGVEAYTYRHMFPKDVAATLDTIKALGFTEMEGGVPQGLTADAYRKMLDQRGIKMPATGAGYEQIVADPMSVVTMAKALGATYVMVAWIPHQKGNFTLDNAKKAVADFNRVGKILKDNGLMFCYHDHGYEFQPYQNGTLLDYIIQQTDPRYVSFEMDILWTQFGGGDPVALLTKYGNRWKLMHLKDLKKGVKGDLTGGTPPENDVVLGDGQLDMPAILKAAKKVGIRHYFIEDESNHEDIQVPKSIAYLRNLK
ncbi:sugar phosphate isomerase/epimerase [Spirosoma oryzae]|uniref:Sugar phosphate isomerase/epimerase n=1 Tax=Spirosoma oryzae TaxID=1469603 RepID=A0A2T0RWP4_9BACT|nr:TIM barrel protein [Spirosoma oryzae]PRY25609.1 sugar phosphate isomerase/epimerase [Spirosoma oryzae]